MALPFEGTDLSEGYATWYRTWWSLHVHNKFGSWVAFEMGGGGLVLDGVNAKPATEKYPRKMKFRMLVTIAMVQWIYQTALELRTQLTSVLSWVFASCVLRVFLRHKLVFQVGTSWEKWSMRTPCGAGAPSSIMHHDTHHSHHYSPITHIHRQAVNKHIQK